LPSVSEEPPQLIYEALNSGADLAISTEAPPAGLAFQPLAVLPIWAYVPGGHRWAGRDLVTVAELVKERLLLLTGDYSPRRVLDRWVDQGGLTYSSLLEFGTPQVAQAVAAAGRGVAIVSDDARFDLHPLAVIGTGGSLHIKLYAAWDREHHAAIAIGAIARRLSEYCIQRYGPQVAPTAPRTPAPPPPARVTP
jgi:DNA-binding transcriptional LysR family regulator